MTKPPDAFTPTRRYMERLASRFHIGFLAIMSFGSAFLFCAVLLASHFHVWGFSEEELAVIDKLPVSVVMLAAGAGAFCLFFPFFLALYCIRWVLSELRRLEQTIKHEKE